MAKSNSILADFQEADRIPPKTRTSWAYKVLDAFMGDERKVIFTELENDQKAAAKQVALSKELKSEKSPFAGKVNVERRGNRVYLEKI